MSLTLRDLGWSPFFAQQLDGDAPPLRIAQVHRDRIEAISPDGTQMLTTPPETPTGAFAVGDWILAEDHCISHLFDRQTLLQRRAAGDEARIQLIAANVDTLFIVTSCNADFNPARLERYLSLAHEAGCLPVMVLTKSDLTKDPEDYAAQAQKLDRRAPVLVVDALAGDTAAQLAAWCGRGQTAALVGSSGVGKTTLANALTGGSEATAAVREDDARGRHTTTSRALRPMVHGGWMIDTPGMRALRLTEVAEGIDAVFDDISALEGQCRFSDSRHGPEPGCALQAAISDGVLEQSRFDRWQKLRREETRHGASLAQARSRDKAFGKMVNAVVKGKKGRARE